MKTFLQQSHGNKVRVNQTLNADYNILPGEIRDTSFIPAAARDECTNGFRWLIATSDSTSKLYEHLLGLMSDKTCCPRCPILAHHT